MKSMQALLHLISSLEDKISMLEYKKRKLRNLYSDDELTIKIEKVNKDISHLYSKLSHLEDELETITMKVESYKGVKSYVGC